MNKVNSIYTKRKKYRVVAGESLADNKISTLSLGENSFYFVERSGGYRYMTARVSSRSPSPSAITYGDDAIEVSRRSSDWLNFFGIKGVGESTAITIPHPTKGNIPAVEFPLRGIHIEQREDFTYVSMTDNPNDPDYNYFAHTLYGIARPYFRLAKAKETTNPQELRSFSYWQGPSQQGGLKRTVGTYEGVTGLQTFYQRLYLQVMYILMYGNLNSQKVIGESRLFGLEDLWNGLEFIDGLYLKCKFNPQGKQYDTKLYASTSVRGDTNSPKTTELLAGDFTGGRYMIVPQGNNFLGFLPRTVGEEAGAETYFCDAPSIGLSPEDAITKGYNDNQVKTLYCGIGKNGADPQSGIFATRVEYLDEVGSARICYIPFK